MSWKNVVFYSVVKKKIIITQATTWMNPEHIMLSKISQSQKDIYCDSTSLRYPA